MLNGGRARRNDEIRHDILHPALCAMKQVIVWKTDEQRERAMRMLQEQAANGLRPTIAPILLEAYPAELSGDDAAGWMLQSTSLPNVVAEGPTHDECAEAYVAAVVRYVSGR